MKVSLVLIISVCLRATHGLDYKFIKIETCSSSDKKAVLFESCTLSESRLEMNFVFDVIQPMDGLIVSLKLQNINNYKFSYSQFDLTLLTKTKTGFRQFFKIPPIDWCSVVKGGKSSNALVKSLLKAFKENCPQLFMRCPLSGHFELLNVKANKELISIYPVGLFRFVLKTSDSRNITLTVSILLEVYN